MKIKIVNSSYISHLQSNEKFSVPASSSASERTHTRERGRERELVLKD